MCSGRTSAHGCLPLIASKRELRRRERQDKNTSWSMLGVAAASGLRETHPESWVAKALTFPDGFPGGRRPFRLNKSTNFGLHRSAPFGPAPLYGHTEKLDVIVVSMWLITWFLLECLLVFALVPERRRSRFSMHTLGAVTPSICHPVGGAFLAKPSLVDLALDAFFVILGD